MSTYTGKTMTLSGNLTELYIPGQGVDSDLLLVPSPYILFASPLPILSGMGPLALVLTALAEPRDFDSNPHWKTKVGTADLWYRRFVCGELARKRIDKSINDWKLPRQFPKEGKTLIRLEADLWGAALEVAEALYCDSIIPPISHPALTLLYLINEAELVRFVAAEMPPRTVTDYIKLKQQENAKLKKRGNPFNRFSFTGRFINLCLARRSPQMETVLTNLVQARMRFTSHWRSTHPSKSSEITQENRGRKPKVQPKKRGRPRKN